MEQTLLRRVDCKKCDACINIFSFSLLTLFLKIPLVDKNNAPLPFPY